MIRGGRAVHVPSGSEVNRQRLASWKTAVVDSARHYAGSLLTGPVGVSIVFRFPMRVADVKRGHPRPNAPRYHTSKPDVDKLLRSTLDAITSSGVWTDDSQVSISLAAKAYVPPGAWIGAQVFIGSVTDSGFADRFIGAIADSERPS